MNGIVVEGLSKTYRSRLTRRRTQALADVHLTVNPGEVFGVIGPNGAGKTTLVGCLLGFLRPDSGSVTIDGSPPDHVEVRRATGFLPERFSYDRWMNGAEFLRYHHALARLPASSRRQETDAALERIGLAAAGGKRIATYSRGMLQRLGLAQALLGRPRYLFLDEPMSGVDPEGVVLFRRLLGEAKAQGSTVVLNSHNLDEVERACDRVAFVRGGRVEAVETPMAGAGQARILKVRASGEWLRTAGASEAVANAAARAGAKVVEISASSARFDVADDDRAARLLGALIQAGMPVTEATPEGGRLERLFLGPKEGGTP